MIETLLHSVLTNDVATKTIVVARVYFGEAPQNPTLPFIAFQQIASSPYELHHGGAVDIRQGVFQFDCIAATPAAAKQLSNAVCNALHAYKGTLSSDEVCLAQVLNVAELYDEDTSEYSSVVDVQVTYREG